VSRSILESALKPELLLFDLGGVLVEWAGPRELGRYLRRASTPDVILQRWIDCPHTKEFERGKLTAAEWAARFIKDWDIDLAQDEFLSEFRGWSRRILPGARELLDQLRPHYRLAALSNSNEVHWQRNTQELGILDLFEFAISSHQVGLCKPDPQIFEFAVERANVSSRAAIVFFDDLGVNIDAAKTAGLRAHCVRGVDELRDRLVSEHLL
jgi:putative hydrolase of the HAD superfamily